MAPDEKRESPPRSPEAVRAELERTRAELMNSVSALRDEVAQSADWRTYVRRWPLESLVAAFLVGYVLARRG